MILDEDEIVLFTQHQTDKFSFDIILPSYNARKLISEQLKQSKNNC